MLTQERLKELLHYDPETGVMKWKIKRGRSHGRDEAGYLGPDGYWRVVVDCKPCLRSRLAWFYMTGKWPREMVDHINRTRSDDRFVNLRQASRSQNNANTPVRARSKTGFKGVRPHRDRFVAQIATGNGGVRYLGIRDTPEEAHELYVAAAKDQFGEFARAA
jgi:hypothetical protein